MSITNGSQGKTKKDQKKAAKAREQAWEALSNSLHAILQRTLDENRPQFEMAYAAGLSMSVFIRILDPNPPLDPPAEPPVQLVTP